jgi:GAF domain
VEPRGFFRAVGVARPLPLSLAGSVRVDDLRREFWMHKTSAHLWAVEVSARDESLFACCGPFTARAARVVALDQLAYGRGPTLDWLRGHRAEFERYDARDESCRRVEAPRPDAISAEAVDALLTEAGRLSRAEAGTVYIREPLGLRFAAAHNEQLERRHGWAEARRRLTAGSLPLAERSIASYVLLTHQAVNVVDAYAPSPDLPYVFNPAWDVKNDYRTQSVLALPLRDTRGDVVGVLQLINARDATGRRVSFSTALQEEIAVLLVAWAQRMGWAQRMARA